LDFLQMRLLDVVFYRTPISIYCVHVTLLHEKSMPKSQQSLPSPISAARSVAPDWWPEFLVAGQTVRPRAERVLWLAIRHQAEFFGAPPDILVHGPAPQNLTLKLDAFKYPRGRPPRQFPLFAFLLPLSPNAMAAATPSLSTS
jgi:hypothetical protein